MNSSLAQAINNIQSLRRLLKAGADPNGLQEGSNEPALIVAINRESPKMEIVRLLLEHGADPHRKGRFGATPLAIACRKNREDLATLLIEKGGDVNSVDDYQQTPLHEAAKHGNEECARILLEAGANIDAPDYKLDTPLHLAAETYVTPIIRLLLDRGADVQSKNKFGRTPLLHACFKGRRKAALMLIESCAAIDARDETGATSLQLACEILESPIYFDASFRKEKLELVRMLLERGADVNTTDLQGRTALLRTTASIWKNYPGSSGSALTEVLELLLEAGADTETRATDSLTPLMMAAIAGNATVLALLLKKGAAIHAQDRFGVTSLMLAVIHKRNDAEKLLLEAGADTRIETRSHATASPLVESPAVTGMNRICEFFECPICTALPDSVSVDKASGEEQLPPAFLRLVPSGPDTGSGHVTCIPHHCPYCGTDYIFENDYDAGMPPLDYDSLQRLPRKQDTSGI